MSDIGSTCDLRVEDPSSQIPGRLQTDDSSSAHAHIYTIGGPTRLQTRGNCGYSHNLVASRSLKSYISLILLAVTCENSGRSCTCRKSVVSHHKSVGGRSQVYHDGRALVGTARVSCRYTYDRHARVPALACQHKSLL